MLVALLLIKLQVRNLHFYLKRGLRYRCFPVNCTKSSRKTYFPEDVQSAPSETFSISEHKIMKS